MWATLLILAALPAPGGTAVETCDLIEINHVHDRDTGKPILCQAVFYDWRPQQGAHQVRAWRLLKVDADRNPLPGQRPERDFTRGGWVMIFHDGGQLREVRAAAMRETWTQYDVEQDERNRLPKEYRPGLLFERKDF